MENLNNLINKQNTATLKKNYIEACSDKDFKNYVNNLNIEECLLIKYTSSLMDAVIEIKECKECSSFNNCTHSVKGYVLTPEKIDKRLRFSYVACKKYQSYLENNKNVTYFDIPKNIKNASFKDLYSDDKKRVPIIKYFKEFIEASIKGEKCKGIYLTGNFGTGKTYLIAALFNELSKKGFKSTVIHYPEFLRSLKSSFKDDYEEKFNYIKKSKILLIDDIGAENCSSWNRDEVLSIILQYRMEEDLPTFFTSNFSLEELEEHLATTNIGIEKVKARRIIERIKYLTVNLSLVTKNRRN